jgi:glycerophosphoryl diester phosphodiesterase
MRSQFILFLLGSALTVSIVNGKDECLGHSLNIPSASAKQKLVIAHRGASAHVPEHTLAAYRLAMELGADYIEPDLVLTSDGHLVAMHTSDLNVTTNVADVFGDREPWFSSFVNRSGYWAFNFTVEEIGQLRVKQRLPAARSTLFDGIWGVPSLKEILNLLNEYNTVELKTILGDSADNDESPSPLELAQMGLYVELKDSAWVKQETGFDLVELLLSHIQTFKDDWEPLLRCYSSMRYDQFKVPGLVLQSFDVVSLERLHELWSSVLAEYAEPPLIVLVSSPDCWNDEFWFQMGDTWRTFVSGIGPDKKCMLDDEGGPVFVQKAEEFGMVLHPWTERPEADYVTPGFANAFAETKHLLCSLNAQAVFSESITNAITAIAAGCDSTGEKETDTDMVTLAPTVSNATGDATNSPAESKSSTPTVCSSDRTSSNTNAYVPVSTFILGVVLTALVSCYINRRRYRERFGVRALPSFESSDLELT